jgi:hypothetical protein
MSREKTSKGRSSDKTSKGKKKLRKLAKASRRTGKTPTAGRSTMHSDPIPFHPAAGLEDGAAVIHPVSAEAMDEAAHKAAELADAVAHHTTASADVEHTLAQDTAAIAESSGNAMAAAQDATGTIVDEVSHSTAELARETLAVAVEPESQAGSAGRTDSSALALYNGKIIEIVQSNIAATTALLSALIEAKSLPEAVEINNDHMRRQLSAMTTQGRELASLAQTLSLDAMKPFAGFFARHG